MAPRTAAVVDQPVDMKHIIDRALQRALGGGIAGAAAMGVQVGSLMWLRTIMNTQYRNGGSFLPTIRLLYAQGGIPRFYSGLTAALAQAPLSRFGDTAANTGVMSFMNATPSTRDLPVVVKTACASTVAALWRVVLMPIDTTKTVMQIEGKHGFGKLREKVRLGGVRVLFHGSVAAITASWAGNFPWFFTFNELQAIVPPAEGGVKKLARNAGIGFCASVVSDTVSNSIRVTKVTKQAWPTSITYMGAVREVVSKDGITGLMFRGLSTRLLANGLQGMMFSVAWRAIDDKFFKKPEDAA